MDDKQRAEFGSWLRQHRNALKLNQTEAGRLAKMSRTQWTRLERGESGTKYANIPKIAKAVGANLYQTYLLAGYDPPKDSSGGYARSKFESLFQRFKQLRPEQRRIISELIDMVEREIDRLAHESKHRVA